MTGLVKNGVLADDPWCTLEDGAPLPHDAPVIVSRARYVSELQGVAGRNAPLALRLEAGETLDGLEADLGRFAMIVLSFPKYTDGRAYSLARLLRERHGYRGELRAVGDVLWDQIPLMKRCGIDQFEIADERVLKALVEGRIKDVPVHFQPAALDTTELSPPGARPWMRLDPQ